MTLSELFTHKRDDVLRIAARYGAGNVRIFGSSHGEAKSDSDVEVLVDLEPGRSLLDLGGLLMELQELLGCGVDVVTEQGLRPRIRERVLREAVPLGRDDRERLLDIQEAIERIERQFHELQSDCGNKWNIKSRR